MIGQLAFCLTAASALDPARVTQSASYRFVTDTEKSTWNAKQPAGSYATLGGSNTFSVINPLITPAESWIGPSSTTGIYFKSGNVGIGTTAPGSLLEVYKDQVSTTRIVINNPSVVNGAFKVISFKEGSNEQSYIGVASSGDATEPHRMFIWNTENARLQFGTNGSERMTILGSGNVGIGTTGPTAYLHLKAGTATASTAPLKFASGVSLTTPEAGAVEFNGTDFFLTPSTVRWKVARLPNSAAPAYTVTNAATDRSYDADATSLEELADVLGSLIADLKLTNIIA
jgi:hypothetical protein